MDQSGIDAAIGSQDEIAIPVNACCDRLSGIVAKIESCDVVLKMRKLDPAMSQVAHRLIAVIERGIERLSKNASDAVQADPQARQARISKIDSQLEGLDELCDQLLQIIHQPARREPIPTV